MPVSTWQMVLILRLVCQRETEREIVHSGNALASKRGKRGTRKGCMKEYQTLSVTVITTNRKTKLHVCGTGAAGTSGGAHG